ncbi:ABC transporter substrate-binding protein [Martelella alba]|uniref:ABC transporter substrate-binding protein n=1 Tax=Martelella alba TaxID=2590451 RepID=A0A506U904_9HYPH|nr:ABC transporter substrate-binding protein [Martelella alba]TPW30912.1 ABC transporter substrate-binding protein [Martelella alba]
MIRHTKAAALSATAILTLLAASAPAMALDKVKFGTNWLAEAEHGGYYQAVADGTYEKYGLDVEIVQGGPQAANSALLIAGKIDFYMGSPQGSINAIIQDIPIMDVAAIFQKDPQILMAHPDQGIEKFEDLASLPTILMGKDGFLSYFEWMKANFTGFSDSQYKPYTFNPAPFIADPKSAQQGYLTSEPFAVEQQAGWTPKVFLLADQGYSPYSETITVQKKLVEENPDLVQRFVDATIIGWYNYLYHDNSAANALIKKDNPDMTDEQLAYSIAKMKEYGLVESGDADEGGIGCMTDAHYKKFYDEMAAVSLFESGVEFTKAYTTDFVCKNVGADLKP